MKFIDTRLNSFGDGQDETPFLWEISFPEHVDTEGIPCTKECCKTQEDEDDLFSSGLEYKHGTCA